MFSGVALRDFVDFVCLGTRTLTRQPQLDKWEQTEFLFSCCSNCPQGTLLKTSVGDHRARKKDDSRFDFLYTWLFGFLIHAGVYNAF